MRTDDKKHQCWLNEGETIRSFHPVLDCALREFADHDAFVSFPSSSCLPGLFGPA